MEYRWSLEKLYKSFEDEKFLEDNKNMPILLNDFISWTKENITTLTKENLEEFLKKSIEVKKSFEKLMAFGQLSYTVNVKDENAKRLIEQCENLFVKFTEIEVIFAESLKNTENLENIINSSDFLKEHSFYLLEIKEDTKYMLSKSEELAIEKIKNTGSRAWSKLQETLTATLNIEVEVDGEKKTLPLPAIRNLAYEDSQDTRKSD